jgi:hypothetical protein
VKQGFAWAAPRRAALRCGLAIALMGLAAQVPAAHAYTHRWDCYRAAGNHCTDFTGTYYNPWHYMSMGTAGYGVHTWCVSGEDRGGGIWNFACAYSGTGVSGSRCDAPDVQAYSYGLGYSGTAFQSDLADTTGGC